MKNNLLIFISSSCLAIGLFGCGEPSFSMLDYYFPLHEIEKNRVFMYEIDIDDNGKKSTDTSYLNIGKIVNDKFYFLTMDKDLMPKDSAIIMIVDGAVQLNQLFLWHEGKYEKGIEENQTIYPKKVMMMENYITNHTFNNLRMEKGAMGIKNSFNVQVVERNDSIATVNMIGRTAFSNNQGRVYHESHETSQIMNKKGVGLWSWSNRMEGYSTIRKLVRIMDEIEWKTLKQKHNNTLAETEHK